MGRKKKVEIESGFDIEPVNPIDQETILEEDETYKALLDVYFKFLVKEKIGFTEEITHRLDKLEIAINKRKKELLGN